MAGPTPNQFVAGFSNPVAFQAVNAGGYTTLNITGWSGNEEVVRLITTHSGSLGLQWCIPGIYDFLANVTANYDLLNMPHAASPLIRAGAKGLTQFAVGTGVTQFFTVGMLITKVNYASPVNGIVSYNFDVGLDGQTGPLIYPS